MTPAQYAITFSRPDRPGIVNAVSGLLFAHGGNILEPQQYSDPETDRFFMRTVFTLADHTAFDAFTPGMAAIAARFDMR